jgi:hypothetical protein
MSSGGKLPDGTVLRAHVDEGMSRKEMAARYDVTEEAVRQALIRHGISAPRVRPSHARYLPWRLRADHTSHALARRLRMYSQHQQGGTLGLSDLKLLDEFMRYCDGENRWRVELSVDYDRADPRGFWLTPRQTGDRDYIRPPRAGSRWSEDSA